MAAKVIKLSQRVFKNVFLFGYIYGYMSDEYRFALIGCGKIAPRHAEQMAKIGTIAAVCDTVKEKAEHIAAIYRASPYYSITDLLLEEKDLDMISICTPNGLHAPHVKECLNMGNHVLCEKPLTICVKDATDLIDIARLNNRKLLVVKSTRYNANVIALKKMLDKCSLGHLFSFQLDCFWNRQPAYYQNTWRGTYSLDGGTLYTQFSHYIDVLCWYFGEAKSVSGIRKNFCHQIEIEDTGVAALEMKNGMIGGINWSVNAYKKNMEISLTVIAERGTIRLSGEYLNDISYQLVEDDIEDLNKHAAHNQTLQGSMSNHDKVYDNLLQALKENHFFPDASEDLKTVALIEQIYSQTKLL